MKHDQPARQELIERIKNGLREESDVLFGYLFGSFASGQTIAKSDVDIAVYFAVKNGIDLLDRRLALIEKLARALQKEVDVLVLNTASPFLRYTMLKEGLLIFERAYEERIEFELKAMNEYFDYKPVLNKYHERLATV